MPPILSLIIVIITAYLVGSFPTGVILAKLFGWSDPRTEHSGHTGGRNTYRVAGFWAGLLVAVIDLSKGIFAVWLASQISDNFWAVPLAGGAAVAGHCWPIWLKFKGGMGLSTGAGAVGFLNPLVIVGAIALLGIFRLFIRHTPRAVLIAIITVPLIIFFLPFDNQQIFWLSLFACLLIAARHTIDWNRVYAEGEL